MTGAAPLLATPGAPIPPGGAAEWFTGAGGARLRAALFVPGGALRGSVVVSPGRTEAVEKYFEVAQRLLERGFAVLVHDWRGQGLSQRLLPDRLLGHAVGHADFLTDYRALLDTFAARLPKPWIALGHSMGGCLTLLALAQGEARFSGAILSAPMLGILTGPVPPPFAALLAVGLTLIGGGGLSVARQTTAATPFEANILTHDRARYERNEALVAAWPDLALGGPTWGWLAFAFGAVFSLEHGPGAARIAAPLTVTLA
nr:alpha/beta hydrolase [Caulobacteraceae bacterium]